MQVSQQIVGVNQRLGNTAVPNMQGTTRAIFDTATRAGAADNFLTYFSGVSARPYPDSNISQNKFEVGESLAVQGISYLYRPVDSTTLNGGFSNAVTTSSSYSSTLILNFYIGNQRVIKDMELWQFSRFNLGESLNTGTDQTVIRLETPIIIPPQIEFYATLRETGSAGGTQQKLLLCLFGTGTLLNTKSNF